MVYTQFLQNDFHLLRFKYILLVDTADIIELSVNFNFTVYPQLMIYYYLQELTIYKCWLSRCILTSIIL